MNWYCIHTRPQREAAVQQYLEHFVSIETYLPRLRQTRVIRRVRRITHGPLFPRYLFCRLEPALHYRAVRYAPDVLDIVHRGSAPALVSDELIAGIRTWAGDVLDRTAMAPAFGAGDLVVIEDGPLMGLQAIVQQPLSDSDRVAVLLSVLDCGARSVLSRSQLSLVRKSAPAGAPPPAHVEVAAAVS